MNSSETADAKKDQAVGKTKEVVGNVTGDRQLREEGREQNTSGHLREAATDVKNAGKDLIDAAKDKARQLDPRH